MYMEYTERAGRRRLWNGGGAGYRLYRRAKEMNNKNKKRGKRALEKRFTGERDCNFLEKEMSVLCERARACVRVYV